MAWASPLLDGVRVLDCSRVLAGPFGTQVLAGLGADVTKVEVPGPDPARGVGPHLGARSLYFSSVNTGKRGVAVDPDDADDRELLAALLDRADVVVTGFRPSAAAALGLDPATLLAAHPRLVVLTVTGYGLGTGREEDGAYDLTVQAEAGLMGVTGHPGGPPARAGVPVGDLAAGLWVALGAVAGLRARDRDGRGGHLEVPLLDGVLPLLSYVGTAALAGDADPGPVGSGHHGAAPYRAYPAADGHVAVGVLADRLWPRLCAALGLDRLAADEGLATNAGRVARREEVDRAVETATAPHPVADLVERLTAAGVPCAPVLGPREALRTPYVASRGVVRTVEAAEGAYEVVADPLSGADAPGWRRPAPAHGEHDAQIRAELGLPARGARDRGA